MPVNGSTNTPVEALIAKAKLVFPETIEDDFVWPASASVVTNVPVNALT